MVIKRVLGFGTYPAVKPIHGGQRRAEAFRNFYEKVGINYAYTCIYHSDHYSQALVGPYDIPLLPPTSDEGPVALIGDILSGRQGAANDSSFHHFLQIVQRLKPDALQLEHPFMWPLAKRLRDTGGARSMPLIYSSHNVEAPLKDAILSGAGVPHAVRQRIRESIEQMEAQICHEAALVVCVTTADRDHYLRYCSAEKIIVVPNGVDRPPEVIQEYAPCREVFQGRPFVFTVGSAYPPNVDGFCNSVLKEGAFTVPPMKSIAVCGGMCDGIINHPLYQRFHAANSTRIQFFPKIEDAELWGTKAHCHVVALPITTGAGSNLKTAEALALGKWIVTTPLAMRGFDNFLDDAEGLIVADDATKFCKAIGQALRSPPLRASDASRKAREALYWDRCFGDSPLSRRVQELA